MSMEHEILTNIKTLSENVVRMSIEVSDIKVCLKGYNGTGGGLIDRIKQLETAPKTAKGERRVNLQIAGLYIGLGLTVIGLILSSIFGV